MERRRRKASAKIVSLARAANLAAAARAKGKIVVATNGCFDILHIGHLRNLEGARRLGDVLIVGVNSDDAVRKLKGKERPIIPQRQRAEILGGLAAVDYVYIFDDTSPIAALRKIKPLIQVKSADAKKSQSPAFVAEKAAIEKNGGRVVVAPHLRGASTTKIIKKLGL